MDDELKDLKRLAKLKARDPSRALRPIDNFAAELEKKLLKPASTLSEIATLYQAECPAELRASTRPTAFARGVLTISARSAPAAHLLRAALGAGLERRIKTLKPTVARVKVHVDLTGAGGGYG